MRATTKRRDLRAFTLVEVMVAVAAMGLVAAVMYALVSFGTALFAKNVAVNMAHQQARNGMMRVARDIHQAVSIPQLVDDKLQAVSSAGPAAGVTFQLVAKGPFKLKNDPSSPHLIQVETPDPKPVAPESGDRLIVIDYNVEADVTRVVGNGNHWNVFLKDGNEKRIAVDNNDFVLCYVTKRVGYLVKEGELRFYPNLTATPEAYFTVAYNITSATPFRIPLNETRTPDNRYTSVTISALDPTYSKRGYKNTSMQLVDARVPYRCQMTKYQ